MAQWLTRLFKREAHPMRADVEDAVLGRMRPSEEGWWEGNVEIGDRMMAFKIGGDSAADAQLLRHAHDIVNGFGEFEQMISDFLQAEAEKLKEIGDEIRQLEIEDLCLFWPDRPDNGMIYFRGPDEFRVWRCDYINRQPKDLGFDS